MKQCFNEFKKDLIFKLKGLPFIRFVTYPFESYARRKQTKKYVQSKDSQRIKIWRDAYKGKRCWIIGNGPSLVVDDIERLSNEITFSSNRIYHIFKETYWRPDFYVAFEPEFTKTNADIFPRLEVKKAKFINLCGKKKNNISDDIFWLNCTSKFTLKKLTTKNIGFSNDISIKVNDAYSVTYTILQIAIYMGFDEIFLLGVDHYSNLQTGDNAHFYMDRKNEYCTPTYVEGIEYGYRLAKKVAEQKGVKIYNATRGGSLEIFNRIDFDSCKL